MSFTALSPNNPIGLFRLSPLEDHKGDWVCPFYHKPTSPTRDPKDIIEIENKNENGVFGKRQFLIIKPANFQCFITKQSWPDNPLDPEEGVLISSCCYTAFKANGIKTWLNMAGKCPYCKSNIEEIPADGIFPVDYSDMPSIPTPTETAPASPASKNITAPTIEPVKYHKIQSLMKLATALTLTAAGITLFFGAFINSSALISGGILSGVGITALNLSKMDPDDVLSNKIQKAASGVLLGAFLNGLCVFLLSYATFTILTSSLLGLGAVVSTIAAAYLYAKKVC